MQTRAQGCRERTACVNSLLVRVDAHASVWCALRALHLHCQPPCSPQSRINCTALRPDVNITNQLQVKDIDQYNRNVAACSLKSEDINAYMVQNGHATAYRCAHYSWGGNHQGGQNAACAVYRYGVLCLQGKVCWPGDAVCVGHAILAHPPTPTHTHLFSCTHSASPRPTPHTHRAITRQYAVHEDKAKQQKVGIWAGTFQKVRQRKRDC